MLTGPNYIDPVVAVTECNSSQVLNLGMNNFDLSVDSVNKFSESGSLFVQTTVGVATVSYSSIDTAKNWFEGCSVVALSSTDPATTEPTFAVFQDTGDTFQIDVPNQTNATANLSYSVVWNSVGGAGANLNYYTLGPGDTYENVSSLGNGAALPAFPVAGAGGTTAISLPYMPITAGRVYFFTGPTSPITAQKASGGAWTITSPTPTTNQGIYDYFEITLDASGVNNTTSSSSPFGIQNLPELTIDTTQVDQFGIPMTLNGSSYNGATTTQLTSGVTDSTAVARDAIISQFQASHPSGDPYNELVLPANLSSLNLPPRILNPGKVTIARTDPLGYLFDSDIQQVFEHPIGGQLTLKDGGNTYTATPGTISAYGSDNQFHNYNVLAITGPGITGTAYIYEPFFSTNAPQSPATSPVSYSGLPPAPSWLSSPSETPGQMVFGNDGVFSDYKAQFIPGSSSQKYDGGTAGILANLENQIVSALNRGVATANVGAQTNTAYWDDASNFYASGQVYNQYAQFLHQEQIGGTPIMIGGNAYAFGYDDQGGNSTTLSLLDQTSATATLGPWAAAFPPSNPDNFITSLYQEVLNRAPETGAVSFWTTYLSGGASRQQVSQDFLDGNEHRTDLIQDYYSNLLHRAPSTAEISYYIQKFNEGWTEGQIRSALYGSDEYFLVRGGGTDSGFADALYRDELNRVPDSQTQVAIAQMLTAGQSRGNVASMVVDSAESETDRVNEYFQVYLGRPADAGDLAHWTSVLAQTGHDSDVESGLLSSAEFYART